MKFKFQLPNAIKLFLFLSFLFWIFTWKFPDAFRSSKQATKISSKEKELKGVRNDAIFLKEEYPDLHASYDPQSYESRTSDRSVISPGILIPSFKEWREIEIGKYEKHFEKDTMLHQNKKSVRRKLNYASSKCGAKILASNPEARHRTAVLSEKSDEYFLNPCRVTTWFAIELCDAVEATQVELANYELYSSSPKEFSVFWSDVYPTYIWHHLGTFIAADKRTMQAFEVGEKNMGKFIKIIIHSHYGKEHYCPLSIIRVIGYSMVQTLEDIEDDKNNVNSDVVIQTQDPIKMSPSEKEDETELVRKISVDHSMKNLYRHEFCYKILTYCSSTSSISILNSCENKLYCRFLHEIIKVLNATCLDVYCPRFFIPKFDVTCIIKQSIDSSSLITPDQNRSKNNYEDSLDKKDIVKDYEYKKSLRIRKENELYTSDILNENYKEQNSKITDDCSTDSIYKSGNNAAGLHSVIPKYLYNILVKSSKSRCKNMKDNTEIGTPREINENFETPEKESSDEIGSAGLINKQSVLYKLAARVRTSEADLNLVNKYLQQLSQSYRHQVEDMKNRLNNTFTEMTTSSENITATNVKQEKNIDVLKRKIELLNQKIDFLMKGKTELIKRVGELHAFFLILEIIIIATVFSIFMNIFHRKNSQHENKFAKNIH